jgi:uncharacterized protein (TIGR02145 family)
MNKLIAIVAISAFITSCNNNSESKTDYASDSSVSGKTISSDSIRSPSSTNSSISKTQTSIGKKSVTIGKQEWTTQNLNVTKYRNGDSIPQVTDDKQWANLTTGAWCYYNNDPENDSVYGKLYNWHAVKDARGISPKGWHIPTQSEWNDIIIFLGGDSTAGGKMKAAILWHTMIPGTNESGFTGLPGGYRLDNGKFATLGNFGN